MEILCQENHILIFNWDNTDSSNWLKCSDLYGTYLMSCFLWIQQIHIKGDLFYWCCLKFKDFFLLSKGIWEFCRLWVSKKFVSLLVSQLPKKRAGWHPTVLAHKKPTWPAHMPDCLCLLQKVWQGAQDKVSHLLGLCIILMGLPPPTAKALWRNQLWTAPSFAFPCQVTKQGHWWHRKKLGFWQMSESSWCLAPKHVMRVT